MRSSLFQRMRLPGALVFAALVLALPAAAARTATVPLAPLTTGFADPWVLSGPNPTAEPYADAHALGARTVRLYVDWSHVAPARPAHPLDPRDPAYRWTLVDAQVRQTVAHGMEPVVDILNAPAWALTAIPGATDRAPSPDALGAFAHAAAERYSGATARVPQVRTWQVWNEPNLSRYLKPQRLHGTPFSPGWYRSMVVAFGNAVKAVDPANVVIAGGLTPFAQSDGIAPLDFTRAFFCLSATLRKTCKTRLPIDAWGVHPYTRGGPTVKARVAGNQSLGDLPELRRILDAAARTGAVGKLGEWADEFCWASSPPVSGGVPMPILTRWVAEALYRMWTDGITNVTWFQLYDNGPQEAYHCGLSTAAKRTKPAGAAFRFPFVAYPGAQTRVWGRTPGSRGGTVTIEIRNNGGPWVPVATMHADAHGMFAGPVDLPSWQQVRARIGGRASPGFAVTAPVAPRITHLF